MCCWPWGDATYDSKHAWHITLAGIQALAEPVPATGFLGLWPLPDDTETAVRAQLSEAA